EDVAEIAMRLRIVRLELDSSAIMNCRFARAAERLQGERHVIAAIRHAIIDRDRAADHIQGGLRLTALQGADAEMVQAAEMPPVGRQHLPVETFGFEQLTGLMMAHGEREQRRSAGCRRAGTLSGGAPVFSIHGSAASVTNSGASRRLRLRASA